MENASSHHYRPTPYDVVGLMFHGDYAVFLCLHHTLIRSSIKCYENLLCWIDGFYATSWGTTYDGSDTMPNKLSDAHPSAEAFWRHSLKLDLLLLYGFELSCQKNIYGRNILASRQDWLRMDSTWPIGAVGLFSREDEIRSHPDRKRSFTSFVSLCFLANLLMDVKWKPSACPLAF